MPRYHRKSAPSPKHPEFAGLRPADQDAVRAMAAILRVAIGLDRTHAAQVASLRCRIERRSVSIDVVAVPDADISLEIYTATERRELLEQVLGRRVELVEAEPLSPPADLAARAGSMT